MKKSVVFIALLLVSTSLAFGQRGQAVPSLRPPDANLMTHFAAIDRLLSPSARTKVQQAATALVRDERTPPDLVMNSARAQVGAVFPGNSLGSTDIEGVAFIIIMQATKEMDEDLKQIMSAVRDAAAMKDSLRKMSMELTAAPKLGASTRSAQSCVEELSQAAQLELQRQMERRSKFLEIAGRLAKSAAEVSAGIIGNLK